MPITAASVRKPIRSRRDEEVTEDRVRKASRPVYRSEAPANDDRALQTGIWAVIITVLILAFAYWRSILSLVHVWDTDPNYSHGYLVPLVSAFFAYRAAQRYGFPIGEPVPGIQVAMGLIEIIGGMIMHTSGWFTNAPLIDVMSLVVVLHGLVIVAGGLEMSKAYFCAVLYLIFMAPLPIFIYQNFAIFMQDLVSVVSVGVLNLCGVEAYRTGSIVHMPGDYKMEVGAACSGLRQLTAFLALSVAAAHLSDRRMWYKWSLVLLSVPTAIAANCVRVTLTGFIMMLFGVEKAEGVFHTLEGLAVFIVGVGLFLGFSWILTKIDDKLGGAPAADANDLAQASAAAGNPAWKMRLKDAT